MQRRIAVDHGDNAPREVARVPLPTPFGTFEVRAFQCSSSYVYLALVAGDIDDGRSVLTRLHSECLTGDALSSLRCDCGIQLRNSLRSIAAEGRGVLIYATGHEGRGIGLVNKLRAYVEQDRGSDTIDANLHLGLPVDGRDYADAAAVLKTLGVESVRLITNNPRKVEALERGGIEVESVSSVPVAAHARNLEYLRTNQQRLGHSAPFGRELAEMVDVPADVTEALGQIRSHGARPHVIVKYAQSLDGRIATATGDSKWISSDAERAISHTLRARCDAIMVGVGTVLADDPQLTVRLVPGASPLRVILDSSLRIPLDARVLDEEAATVVITTDRSDAGKRRELRGRHVAVRVVEGNERGVDVRAALGLVHDLGVRSLLVEGGAKVITSLFSAAVVDRVIVAVAPVLLGRGVEGVGDLGTSVVADGVALTNQSVYFAGPDLLIAADVEAPEEPDSSASSSSTRLKASRSSAPATS